MLSKSPNASVQGTLTRLGAARRLAVQRPDSFKVWLAGLNL